MATEKVILEDTAPAGADLSSKQYTLVKRSSGNLVAAGAGDKSYVLQDNPTSGHYGTFGLVGISKVKLGGTVAQDDFLASNASGLAITATTGQRTVGVANKAGVSGDIIEMLIVISLA